MNMIATDGETREAMHMEVAVWIAEVFWDMMGKKLLKNAWQKMGYNWFKGVVEEEGVYSDGDEDNNGNKEDDDEAHNNYNNDNDNEAHDKDGEDDEEWED